MKKINLIIEKVKTLLFGKREIFVLPKKKFPEREFNEDEFYQWCNEFRVSCMVNKQHLI
jgi:hypothetical protein